MTYNVSSGPLNPTIPISSTAGQELLQYNKTTNITNDLFCV